MADPEETVVARERGWVDAARAFEDTVVSPRRGEWAPRPRGRHAAISAGEQQLRVVLGERTVDFACVLIVGRAPRSPRIVDTPPTLEAVASPEREISANHLELRRVGRTVVATDLRSTNGTLVHLPDGAARALRHGDSIVVPAGTRLDLGENVVIGIEPAEAAS